LDPREEGDPKAQSQKGKEELKLRKLLKAEHKVAQLLRMREVGNEI